MNNRKKISFAALATIVIAASAIAQDQKENLSKDKNEKTQEIIIRKKGSASEKMTIVVDGDNVTINGKPADQFKDDDVTVFKRDRPLAMASPHLKRYNRLLDQQNFSDLMPSSDNKALLGVMTEKSENGVKVKDVNKESGAQKAGLKKDDVITKVGSTEIRDPQDLIKAIGEHKPNDKVDITYNRGGKENKTSVTLGENKSQAFAYNFNNNDFNFKTPLLENFNFNFDKPKIGLQIPDIEDGKGVKVKDVDEDSPAAKAGLKESDVITQVNGKDVAGVEDLRSQVKDLKEGDAIKFTYKRDGKNQTAEIKIPKRLKSADL